VTTFADFIAPLDIQDFRETYFGKRPVHIQRGGAPVPDIFNWARFNRSLAITPYWTEDSLKLYFKSRAALRDSYCDAPEAKGRAAPVNPAKVKALIAVGASVVANHIHRVCPEIGAVANVLAEDFAARTFANVYCSFKGVQAFQTHYDLHDVFAFQAEGEKVWRVYEARADAPVSPVPPGDEAEQWLINSRGKVLFEAHMKPGDVIYLPRGQYHDALTGAEASLHVTFGVSPPTGLGLFKLLEAAVTGEGAFRSYLPDARDEAALRARLGQLAERVKTVLTSPAFATDVLNHQRGLQSPEAKYDLPIQGAPTWYSLARPAQVVRRDQGFILAFEGGEIGLGALYPTAEWMLQQKRFSAEEAAVRQVGASRAELLALLGRLVDAGVLLQTEMRS
jgi:bifunctional lysine-specific demethylase and histidyl-hydroxylase NO66